MKALSLFSPANKFAKAPIILNLSGFSELNEETTVHIDLFKMSDNEKKLLAAILHTIAGNSEIPKLPKKIPVELIINGKKITVTFSHTLRQSTRDGKPVFNIMISKSQIPILGKGSFGVTKKFFNLIKLTNTEINSVNEERVNKKQICENKNSAVEIEFRQHIQRETEAAKVLYQGYDVDIHWFSRNNKGELIAHQSLPFVGVPSMNHINISETSFRKLSLREQLFAIVSLVNQLKSFHEKGYAHRDIKPANIMIDLNKKILVAIDPGIAMKAGETQIYGGTPLYTPFSVIEESRKNKTFTLDQAQQLDVYALGLTIAQLFGVPQSQIKEIYYNQNKNRENYFNNIAITDLEIKKELIGLLIEMTQPDYSQVPRMENCSKRLRKLLEKLFFTPLEKLNEKMEEMEVLLEAVKKNNKNKMVENQCIQLEKRIKDFKYKITTQLNNKNDVKFFENIAADLCNTEKMFQECANEFQTIFDDVIVLQKLARYVNQLETLNEIFKKLESNFQAEVGKATHKVIVEQRTPLEKSIKAFKSTINFQLTDNDIMEKIKNNTINLENEYTQFESKLNRITKKLASLILLKKQQTSFWGVVDKVPVINYDLEQCFYSFLRHKKSSQATIPKTEPSVLTMEK